MTLTAYIELPYDRGHQWHLVVGDKRAVINQRAAFVLVGRFGLPVQGEPRLSENLSGVAEECYRRGFNAGLDAMKRAVMDMVDKSNLRKQPSDDED